MTHDHCHCAPPPPIALWGHSVNKVNKQGETQFLAGARPGQCWKGQARLFLSFHMPSEAGWTVSCPDYHPGLPQKDLVLQTGQRSGPRPAPAAAV